MLPRKTSLVLLVKLLLLCSSCGISLGNEAETLQQSQPPQLDQSAVRAVLSTAMRCQNLSRVHAAVVHAGKHLYSLKLQLQPDGSVTDISGDSVLLPIASVSKGMFGTALTFVQNHLREVKGDQYFDLLTTPIKRLLGGDESFWFLDHVRTDQVTIEDLTSHTTGLSGHEALSLWSGIKDKSELARLTGRFNPSSRFRASYIYNNIVWTIADVTVEKLVGMNFTSYMRKFLWQPLGMNRTVGSSEVDARGLVAQLSCSPKQFGSGRAPFERTELERSLDNVEAAGSIYAPLEDMVKYMQHHTATNYSSYSQPPPPFKAVNAYNSVPAFDPELAVFNSSTVKLSDVPEIETESYGHGWNRQWYRDSLSYEHSGSLFDDHCHLRVMPKRRLSVFAHISLGPSTSPFQTFYANIFSYYITDLLMQNKSFVTQDNVCSMFANVDAGPPQVVPRRALNRAEVETCTGSFGNYGFGTMSVTENATSGLLVATYGTVKLELTPVRLTGDSNSQFSFFLTILRPGGFPVLPPVLSANASHVTLRPNSLNSELSEPQTMLFMRISSTEGGGPGGQRQTVHLTSAALEASARLEKGLRPSDWKRPKLCPEEEPKAAGSGSGSILATAAAAVAVVVAFRA